MTDVIESSPEVDGEAVSPAVSRWEDDASQLRARLRMAIVRRRRAAVRPQAADPVPGVVYQESGPAADEETTLELPAIRREPGDAPGDAPAEATIEMPAVAPAGKTRHAGIPAGPTDVTVVMPAAIAHDPAAGDLTVAIPAIVQDGPASPLTSADPPAGQAPPVAAAAAPAAEPPAGPASVAAAAVPASAVCLTDGMAAAPASSASPASAARTAAVPAGPAKAMAALTAAAPRLALTRLPAVVPGPRLAPAARATPAAVPVPRTTDAPARPAPAPPARPASKPSRVVLPVPPRDDERYRYIRRYAWILSIGSAASFPLVLWSQLRLMLQHHWFLFYFPFMALGAIFLSLPLLTDMWGRSFDFERHRRIVDSWRPVTYPSVDVFLPVCGEPAEVLRNTWMYVARMRRFYRGTVTPYVLDDSASPELKEMARDFGFAYATRPNRGWYKKSGNLLFGFQISQGDYILLLDADFAPRHDLLHHALPYMEAEPRVGIVQTPQFFRIADDQTWVERGAGAVQELFYRAIQPARSRKGGSICVGSCAVYRRAALKDNGGMTLAEHSEDILTGFDLNKKGWKLRYLPVALATGNCPDNVLAFVNQQYRWCAGVVGLLFSKRFWNSNLSAYSRLCYISGNIYYVYSALYTFVVPGLTIAILSCVPQVVAWRNMAFLIPGFLYSAVILPGWHLNPYRLEAWSVRLISGWAHLFAYLDAIRGKKLGWKPSGGDKKKQDGSRRFWISFTLWSVGSSLVWVGLAFWRMLTMNPANFVVLFALGVFELIVAMRVLVQPLTDETT